MFLQIKWSDVGLVQGPFCKPTCLNCAINFVFKERPQLVYIYIYCIGSMSGAIVSLLYLDLFDRLSEPVQDHAAIAMLVLTLSPLPPLALLRATISSLLYLY